MNNKTRRDFIKSSGTLALGSAILPTVDLSGKSMENKPNKVLKVGLVGCGGRGTGAAAQAMNADPDVELIAMGDIFPDKLENSYMALKEENPEKMKVDADHKFIGFDAYKKVIDSGVDVVLLATPPCFRPDHLKAAIAAGKHAFCEKPVAVDAPGVRKVIEAAKEAEQKRLSILSGFCYRYDISNRAIYDRIFNGDIGEIRSITTFRFGGELWSRPRKADWTDMEYQLRNWLYYNWLSGDFITEQAVHSLDLMSWAMGDEVPLKAIGNGGRQKRTDPIYGNVYDHFAVEYVYNGGIKASHFTRQQAGCAGKNTVDVFGSDGHAFFRPGREWEITGKNPWKYEGERNNMYQTEHDEFFAAIRNDKPMNDGVWMANSSMLAVLGRMVGYSGQEITWDEAINSDVKLGPDIEDYDWDLEWPVSDVPVPGITQVL
ncbi:Gfo/Idh/MocA family protein [Membranihabitans maritimus]|uniref:Gfo/Idh/MocA family protein n=1 Tax=Membranihabitans maritimus TaxID=2904244 RepID=UPI001F2B7ED1|nr:Gfo/Idh/MocA family oxidoreductase [Membranihabitans maritimus]